MADQPGTRSPHPREDPGLPTAGGSGLSPNVAGALSYLVGVLTGILFLLPQKC